MRPLGAGCLMCVACASSAPPPFSHDRPDAAAPPAPITGAATPTNDCDALVTKLLASGGVGLTKRDPSIDPICEWRIDDANAAASVQGSLLGGGELKAGHVVSVAGGEVPAKVLATAMSKAARAVLRCTEGDPLWVRFTVSPAGKVSPVLLDYDRTFPASVSKCVQHALDSTRMPRPRGDAVTVSWLIARTT